jgi:hypothetical protein
MQALFQSAQQLYEKREGSRIRISDKWIGIWKAQKYADPADPDPVPGPDPQHCFFLLFILDKYRTPACILRVYIHEGCQSVRIMPDDMALPYLCLQ